MDPDVEDALRLLWREKARVGSMEALAGLTGIATSTLYNWKGGRAVPIGANQELLMAWAASQRVAPAGTNAERAAWSRGVRHSVSTVMRALAALIDEAEGSSDSDEAKALAAIQRDATPPAARPAPQASAPKARRKATG